MVALVASPICTKKRKVKKQIQFVLFPFLLPSICFLVNASTLVHTHIQRADLQYPVPFALFLISLPPPIRHEIFTC